MILITMPPGIYHTTSLGGLDPQVGKHCGVYIHSLIGNPKLNCNLPNLNLYTTPVRTGTVLARDECNCRETKSGTTDSEPQPFLLRRAENDTNHSHN